MISDTELCMLEQLTYLDANLLAQAGIIPNTQVNKIDVENMWDEHKNWTLTDMLEKIGFTDKALERLSTMAYAEIPYAYMSGLEWAQIIKYIKNSDLGKLKVGGFMPCSDEDDDRAVLGISFYNDSGDAIVAFRGTYGVEEWVDNVYGLNSSDTECQRDALKYIESLPHDNITVVGHSKGGNKAMYVAITSEKIGRCVSFDGQGFSKQFMDKYWLEIDVKAEKITNYSLSCDYIHMLMFPVPESTQLYCQGYGMDNLKQYHSSNSFFKVDGSGMLVLDNDDKPTFSIVEEDDSIKMVHNFITFFMNNATKEDMRSVTDLVSLLIPLVFEEQDVAIENAKNILLKDKETFALIIAYLARYVREYNISVYEIDDLVQILGLDYQHFMTMSLDLYHFGEKTEVGSIVAWLVVVLSQQLYVQSNDSDNDIIINGIMSVIDYNNWVGLDMSVKEFWTLLNKKTQSIVITKGVENYQPKKGAIHDYSVSVYNTIMNAINRISSKKSSGLTEWNKYSQYDWYASLGSYTVRNSINNYMDNVSRVNSANRRKVDDMFEAAREIDKRNATKIESDIEVLKALNKNISNCILNVKVVK